MLKQVESPVHAPDSLLLSLESDIALRRARREHQGAHRGAVLIGGLVLIVGGAGLALCALLSTLRELPRGATAGNAPTHAVSNP
jgi:hypothetical protein